jgi:L-2-hydroxyglutarate oxidase LhgO
VGAEPACTAALWSPETGIVDSHGYMLALQGEIEDHGGCVAFETPVTRIETSTAGFRVTTGGVEARRHHMPALVNSAGLYAHDVARSIEGYRAALIPKLVLAKGNYFGCSGKPAFSRLIYPAPVDGGLGVHVTLDLVGRMRFGPDVEWLSTNDPAGRLSRRSEAVGFVLRRDPPLLAGPAGRRHHAGLFRLPPQAFRAGRAGGRFPYRRA